jgi:hypothetical protein
MFLQDQFDAVELTSGEAVVLAQVNRSFRAVQIEERFMLWADDVNVCGPVVVRVDDYSKIANSQDGSAREEGNIFLSGWVNFC